MSGVFLPTFTWRQVVVPDALGLLALGEEQQVGLHARASGREDPARQAHDCPKVAFVDQLALRLNEGAFVGPEQHAFVENDGAGALRSQLGKDVLDEQHLRRAGLEGKVLLRVLAFLSAEWRVGQDDIELLRRLVEQRAVGRPAREGVAMPEIGLVDPVQNEVGQRDRDDEVLLFATEEGVVLQRRRDPC
ncbi:MAG: hypothetical protein V9E89_19250 [Ilumatobacteraceae bacterium]